MAEGAEENLRHSKAEAPSVLLTETERAEREALNALLQAKRLDEMIEHFVVAGNERPFRLRPSAVLDLNRIAIDGLDAFAGNWRPGTVVISGSQHQPPPAHLVPELVEEMCDYVNDNWAKTATHLAAYVMWRMNWIHAFTDGNGRTARAVSYLVLSIRLKMKIPGNPTIPEMIIDNRQPYYKALEAADTSVVDKSFDLTAMENLLEALLAKQLLTVVSEATGHSYP